MVCGRLRVGGQHEHGVAGAAANGERGPGDAGDEGCAADVDALAPVQFEAQIVGDDIRPERIAGFAHAIGDDEAVDLGLLDAGIGERARHHFAGEIVSASAGRDFDLGFGAANDNDVSHGSFHPIGPVSARLARPQTISILFYDMSGVNVRAADQSRRSQRRDAKTARLPREETLDLAAIETTLRQAIGRRAVIEDYVAPMMVARLAATLEVDAPRVGRSVAARMAHDLLPRSAEAGANSIPTDCRAASTLIPPVDMPRRMFGGARLSFHAPLTVGQTLRCESELADAKVRSTATAHLAIATLRHRFFGSDGLAVVEEQDIVHMQPIDGGHEKAAPPADPMPGADLAA